MSDAFGVVTWYSQIDKDGRKHYITAAPERIRMTTALLGSPFISVNVSGTLEFTAENGIVSYKITDFGPNGVLTCEKITDSLEDFVPPDWNA